MPGGGGITLEPNAEIACREQCRGVAVTAGPGAGKTELLAQRADFLLRINACPYPRRILAISFKVDAAANLDARVRERVPPDLASRLDSQTFHGFAYRLIKRFRPVLTGQSQLDRDFTVDSTQRLSRTQITFDDFVPLATEILEQSPLVLAGLRATYSHVFLDEFQDCTANQYALVRQAFLGTDITLTAVGDTKQRIMGWAGALEGIFQTFADDFGALPLNLYQNRRSQPRLRRMQNRMIAVMDPAAAVPVQSLAGDGGRIEILSATDDGAEAARVTTWIRDLVNSGTPESEIAVLFGKQPELYGTALCQALDEARISYRNEQKLQDLAAEPLAKLLVAYFETLTRARNPAAYGRLYRGRLFDRPDEDDLFRLRTSWDAHIRQAHTSLENNGSRLSDRRLLDQLTDGFLNFFGAPAIAALHPDYDSPVRVAEIVKDVIDRTEELLTTHDADARALARFADEPGVRMMSIHKSKGLEFDAVAVMAIEHEMFWGEHSAERAVFFVGISRAKQHLLLTHAHTRRRPPGAKRWETDRSPYREFLDYARETGER
jgi:superfamily I DNA/RNA helicase